MQTSGQEHSSWKAMSVVDTIKGWFGGNVSLASEAHGGGVGYYGRRFEALSTADAAAADAVIHASVRLVSSLVAMCGWSSPNRRVDAVLQKPNSTQTQYEWIASVVNSMLLYGSSPQEIMRTGNMMKLLPMDPRMTQRVMQSSGLVVYEVMGGHGEVERTLPDDMVINFIDIPSYSFEGVSRVESARTRVNILLACDGNAESLIERGAVSAWTLNTTRNLGDEEKLAYAQHMANNIRSGNSVTVLDKDLKLTREKISSPLDEDMREYREDIKREIAAAMGVPPFAAGGDSDTKYNNVSARLEMLRRETIMPIITNVQQRLSNQLGAEIEVDDSHLHVDDGQGDRVGEFPSDTGRGDAPTTIPFPKPVGAN